MSQMTRLSQFGYSEFYVGLMEVLFIAGFLGMKITPNSGALLARYSVASKRMVHRDESGVFLVPRRRSERNRRRKSSVGGPARNARHLRETSDGGPDSMEGVEWRVRRHQFTVDGGWCHERIFFQPYDHVGRSSLDRPHQFDAQIPFLVSFTRSLQRLMFARRPFDRAARPSFRPARLRFIDR